MTPPKQGNRDCVLYSMRRRRRCRGYREQVSRLVQAAIGGEQVSVLRDPAEVNPLPIVLRLAPSHAFEDGGDRGPVCGRGGRPLGFAG